MSQERYKYIITRRQENIYYGYFREDMPLELNCEPEQNDSLLGNIYAARVEKVAEEIGGAFLEIGQGQKCFYPFPKNGSSPLLLPPVSKEEMPSRRSAKKIQLKGGDILLVQVTRDALKSKLPLAQSTISLPGKYFVLTLGDRRTGISRKIHETAERERLAGLTQTLTGCPFGIIVRTNAAGIPEEELKRELVRLKNDHDELMRRASFAQGKTLLYRKPPHYITYPSDLPAGMLTEIITDQEDLFDELQRTYKSSDDREILSKLRFYNDSYELWKLYRMEAHYHRALSKTVWLSSGGSLVIEPTEAMVVIDVNTGTVLRKKSREEDLFYQINREAAVEISRQLRLRNLSGIIVIDFINMPYEKHQKKLLQLLKEECAKDRIRTNVMDITALNLVEMTRQKIRKPLHEQWACCHNHVEEG